MEPFGLDSIEEVLTHRRYHLAKVNDLFSRTDLLVFTLGLTETWINNESGIVLIQLPLALLLGNPDATKFKFKNFGFAEVYADMIEIYQLLMNINPKMKFMLTVCPGSSDRYCKR